MTDSATPTFVDLVSKLGDLEHRLDNLSLSDLPMAQLQSKLALSWLPDALLDLTDPQANVFLSAAVSDGSVLHGPYATTPTTIAGGAAYLQSFTLGVPLSATDRVVPFGLMTGASGAFSWCTTSFQPASTTQLDVIIVNTHPTIAAVGAFFKFFYIAWA